MTSISSEYEFLPTFYICVCVCVALEAPSIFGIYNQARCVIIIFFERYNPRITRLFYAFLLRQRGSGDLTYKIGLVISRSKLTARKNGSRFEPPNSCFSARCTYLIEHLRARNDIIMTECLWGEKMILYKYFERAYMPLLIVHSYSFLLFIFANKTIDAF